MRTKDKKKCSFYKARRKQGLTNEQIKKLWLEKKVLEGAGPKEEPVETKKEG